MFETAYWSSEQVIATNVLTPVEALDRNSCQKHIIYNTIYTRLSHSFKKNKPKKTNKPKLSCKCCALW